jgi:hypothetical protein
LEGQPEGKVYVVLWQHKSLQEKARKNKEAIQQLEATMQVEKILKQAAD